MNLFYAEILEADSPFFSGELKSLRVPISDGDYGIMAGHRDMIAPVVPGVLHFETVDGEKNLAAVGSGFVKIEDGRVLVLVDSLERAEEIDLGRAKKTEEKALYGMFANKNQREYRLAEMSRARAISRYKAKKEYEERNGKQ
ncbi:MAG: ATP synthase F1 subunit epsilon [Eubacterium sp.]|nr:ATP synthase F1 subunit epsilon [Eubacterium sp.]MBR1674128.1 ATP synthase F1 subunit epsilon [Eubacterium sp.]